MSNDLKTIRPGKYKHYKGHYYQVEGTAKHSETEEEHVVYRPLYGKQELWIRPLAMFVERVKYQGKELPRFEYVEEE
ncbi:MAG: DUF1653 domain-containing protein [Pseudomonadales bacterium]|nr:DUF1653 domain-containing protein [Pseudomonadales bacterium]